VWALPLAAGAHLLLPSRERPLSCLRALSPRCLSPVVAAHGPDLGVPPNAGCASFAVVGDRHLQGARAAGLPTLTAMRRSRRVAVVAGFVVCALCITGWAGYLTLERGLMSDTSCPISSDSSNYGEATWSWVGPGVTCTWRGVSYNGTEYILVQKPPLSRAVLSVVLLAWTATLGAVAWTSRRPRSPNVDPLAEFDRGRIAR
jgi:hypothetical protein